MEINVGILQLDSRETVEENLENLEKHVICACSLIKLKPDILVLPEYRLTGFNKNRIDQYFEDDGETKTVKKLRELCNSNKVTIIGSIPHQHGDNNFNGIPWIVYGDTTKDDKKPISWYHKLALFEALGEEEHLNMKSGLVVKRDDKCKIVPIKDLNIRKNEIRVGVSICGELRYPEQSYTYAKNKCQLLINCSQYGEVGRLAQIKISLSLIHIIGKYYSRRVPLNRKLQ